MDDQELLSIGELAQRTGLSVSAIRFYEAKGLVQSTRNGAGHRRFRRPDIRRLSFVLISQQIGFSIREIHSVLEGLPDRRTPTKADWTGISRGFRQALDSRISTLTRLRDRLDGCIGCGCLSLKSCAIYNPGDEAGEEGAGPRYLMGSGPAG